VAQLAEAAFGDFYRRTARPLWIYVYRITGDAADADDVVHDAFHRLLRADLPTLQEEELRRYLFRTASNLVTDRWRKSMRERSFMERVREAIAPSSLPSAGGGGEVAGTFARLKPRERALLWLAYVEERDHEQIAASLGLTRGSVKVLLSRARARLRDLLAAKGLTAKGLTVKA
jgi:RNA polymerase sigma-70 factor, ECF subfamily